MRLGGWSIYLNLNIMLLSVYLIIYFASKETMRSVITSYFYFDRVV